MTPTITPSRPLRISIHSWSISLRTRIAKMMRMTPEITNHTPITMAMLAAIESGLAMAMRPKMMEMAA